MPVKDQTIDVVFSYIVFQHFPSVQMVERNLLEVIRVLRPGGIAKIQLRGKKIQSRVPSFFNWYYGVHFTQDYLIRFFEKSGANVLQVEGINSKYMWVTFQKSAG